MGWLPKQTASVKWGWHQSKSSYVWYRYEINVHCLPFWIWHILIILSRPIHFFFFGKHRDCHYISITFMATLNTIFYVVHIFFISIHQLKGCFHFIFIVTTAAIKMVIQVCCWKDLEFLEYKSWRSVAGPCVCCIFCIFEKTS